MRNKVKKSKESHVSLSHVFRNQKDSCCDLIDRLLEMFVVLPATVKTKFTTSVFSTKSRVKSICILKGDPLRRIKQ